MNTADSSSQGHVIMPTSGELCRILVKAWRLDVKRFAGKERDKTLDRYLAGDDGIPADKVADIHKRIAEAIVKTGLFEGVYSPPMQGVGLHVFNSQDGAPESAQRTRRMPDSASEAAHETIRMLAASWDQMRARFQGAVRRVNPNQYPMAVFLRLLLPHFAIQYATWIKLKCMDSIDAGRLPLWATPKGKGALLWFMLDRCKGKTRSDLASACRSELPTVDDWLRGNDHNCEEPQADKLPAIAAFVSSNGCGLSEAEALMQLRWHYALWAVCEQIHTVVGGWPVVEHFIRRMLTMARMTLDFWKNECSAGPLRDRPIPPDQWPSMILPNLLYGIHRKADRAILKSMRNREGSAEDSATLMFSQDIEAHRLSCDEVPEAVMGRIATCLSGLESYNAMVASGGKLYKSLDALEEDMARLCQMEYGSLTTPPKGDPYWARAQARMDDENSQISGKELAIERGMALYELAWQRGDVTSAMKACRAALAASPDSAELHNAYGDCLLRLKMYDQAVVHFKQASEIHPEWPAPFDMYGMTLVLCGRENDAIEWLNNPGKHRPSMNSRRAMFTGQAYFARAGKLHSQGLLAEERLALEMALGCLQRAVELHSESTVYEQIEGVCVMIAHIAWNLSEIYGMSLKPLAWRFAKRAATYGVPIEEAEKTMKARLYSQ